jgi:alpha-L-fucosidase
MGILKDRVWSPGMVDIVLRGKGGHDWFWRPDREHTIHEVDELMEMYYTSVGRNCNLVIGAVVNNQGLVPETDVRCLGEFGDELDRRFSQPVAETSGSDNVELPLSKPMDIDHLIIMEDISQGERTREYVVNGLTPDGKWHRLCSGQSIGHKRIERFTPIKIASVRLQITEARAAPGIRRLAAFKVSRP